MIEVKIPAGVTFAVEGNRAKATGPKGTVEREFKGTQVSLALDGGVLRARAKSLAIENTVRAHLANMAKGVSEGFVKKMRIKFAHFPATMEVKGRDILIKNFLGEKKARKTKIAGATKIEVKGAEITVSGPDKEDVGQTAANIRTATKIRGHDCRVFQDGIYIVDE